MQNSKTIMMGLLFSLVSSSTWAVTTDEMNQSSYQREFKLLDADNNGKLNVSEISKDELFNGGGFAKADKNRNGSLSENEYVTYKSAVQQKEAKRIARDSAITSKIKSKYLVEKIFKSFDVSVETKDGIVALSGFVDNELTKARAGQIAARVKGVKSVRNGLVVKP